MEPEARKLTPEEKKDLEDMLAIFNRCACVAIIKTFTDKEKETMRWLYDKIIELDPSRTDLEIKLYNCYRY